MSGSKRHRSTLHRPDAISVRLAAVAVIMATLATGCVHANTQPAAVPAEPRDYVIQNLTSCFARIHSTHPDGSGEDVLAEVRPGQQAVVTLEPGLRLFINMHRVADFSFYDRHPRRATNHDVVVYGEECWKSGRVVVRESKPRVASQ